MTDSTQISPSANQRGRTIAQSLPETEGPIVKSNGLGA